MSWSSAPKERPSDEPRPSEPGQDDPLRADRDRPPTSGRIPSTSVIWVIVEPVALPAAKSPSSAQGSDEAVGDFGKVGADGHDHGADDEG